MVKLEMTNKQATVYRYISIRIVKMNGGWCGWNPFKWNFILLKFKKVTVIRCKYFHFTPLRWNGPQLLQYSISKHGAWLIAFFGQNWAKTKYTTFISKHLQHFPMDVLVKNILLEISIKVCGAATSKIITNKQTTR